MEIQEIPIPQSTEYFIVEEEEKKQIQKERIAVYRRWKAETIIDIPAKITIEWHRCRITFEFRKYFREIFFILSKIQKTHN